MMPLMSMIASRWILPVRGQRQSQHWQLQAPLAAQTQLARWESVDAAGVEVEAEAEAEVQAAGSNTDSEELTLA
jgi:hypothetical protein